MSDDKPLSLEGYAIKEANAEKDRLRVVGAGELPPGAPSYAALQAERDDLIRTIDEYKRKLNGALSQLGAMRAERKAEAAAHPLWPAAVIVFDDWRYATGHLRAKWTEDRFDVTLPALSEYSLLDARYAVWGLAAACFRKKVTAKFTQRYDEFWRAFGPSAGVQSADHFENRVNVGRAIFHPWLAEATA